MGEETATHNGSFSDGLRNPVRPPRDRFLALWPLALLNPMFLWALDGGYTWNSLKDVGICQRSGTPKYGLLSGCPFKPTFKSYPQTNRQPHWKPPQGTFLSVRCGRHRPLDRDILHD